MTDCIEYSGEHNGTNIYGGRRINGTPMRASRAAWVETYGQLAPHEHVLHRCDNPPCVNLDHLFVGSHRDNMADAADKGRLTGGRGTSRNKGETNWRAVLTAGHVLEARRLHGTGQTYVQLAETFGVHKSTIRNAVLGIRWGWLTEELREL